MRKAIEALFNSSESTNSIARNTGVAQSSVHRFRTGERSIDNMPLITAERLAEYWGIKKHHTFRLSYDYNDLLEELHADIDEGLIDLGGIIKVERGDVIAVDNQTYTPVVDYYYEDDGTDHIERIQTVKVYDLLDEMNDMNRII